MGEEGDNWMRGPFLQRLTELGNFVDKCALVHLLFIECNTSFEISLFFLRSSQKVHFGLLSFINSRIATRCCLPSCTNNTPMVKSGIL